MKNNLFSIGELSKLYEIPIKTLRYYDEIDLLKPAVIDAKSNYRYYSVEQLILVDSIKNAKLMGLSLAEIKEKVSGELSIAQIEEMVSAQILYYHTQIEAMQKIKTSMEQYLEVITQSKAYPMGEVRIQYESKRYCLSYPYLSKGVEETEVNLRKAFLTSNESKAKVYPIFGASGSWETYLETGEIIYNDIREYNGEERNINGIDYSQEIDRDKVDNTKRIGIEHTKRTDIENGDGLRVINRDKVDVQQTGQAPQTICLEEGEYVTLYFDEPAIRKDIYYDKLKAYIAMHNLKVEGDFNETWLIPRLDEDRKESTLIKLEIKLASGNQV